MQARPAHITISGQPLCQCESYLAGLLSKRLRSGARITCGYRTITAALSAALEIQEHQRRVRIILGPCPEGARND